jgi:hypothetical protein
MPSKWVKSGTRVRVRQFEDETAYEYNRRLRRGQRPTPTYLWRVEDLHGEVVTQCGYCVSRQSAVDAAHRSQLRLEDEAEGYAA